MNVNTHGVRAQVATDKQTNSQASASVSAPSQTRQTIYVYGLLISASAAPAAAVEALFKDGANTVFPIEIPASAFAPIWIPFPTAHPYAVTAGNGCSLVLPALGGTTVGSVQVVYSLGAV